MAPITFEKLTKRFDDLTAVDALDIDVPDGEFLVLVGPSGCGKTTALRMLAGLEEVTSGRILIGDRVVNTLAPGARDVAMVFQSYALYPHMTVFANLAFSLQNRHLPKPEIERRVRAAAEVLELEGLLTRRPKQLSGGQRQRVALARALLAAPRVLVLDDPLSAVDARTERAILDAIERAAKGRTLVLVTHRIAAASRCEKVVVLDEGRLLESGTHAELITAGGVYQRLAERQALEAELESIG